MRNARISVFEVEQSVDALNDALTRKNVSASDVVAIHDIAAGTLAIEEVNRAKYRVFYRD